MRISPFHYARLDKLGDGTYGLVYRARNTITGKVVALK
jgi:serine/threonine protein kinase